MTHCLSCWWRDLSNIQNRSHYARTYCWRVQHLSISVSSKHKIRTTVVVAYDIVVNIKWGIVKSREYLLQMPGASCCWTRFCSLSLHIFFRVSPWRMFLLIFSWIVSSVPLNLNLSSLLDRQVWYPETGFSVRMICSQRILQVFFYWHFSTRI